MVNLAQVFSDGLLLDIWRIAAADGGKILLGVLALSGLYSFIKEVTAVHQLRAPSGPPYKRVIVWQRDRRQALVYGWAIIILTLVMPIVYMHLAVTLPKDPQPPLVSLVRTELMTLFVAAPVFVVLQFLFYFRLSSVRAA